MGVDEFLAVWYGVYTVSTTAHSEPRPRRKRGNEMAVVRVNITLTDELLARIDKEAETYGDNRSNFIRRAVINYLDQQQALRLAPEMTRAVVEAQKLVEQNKDIQMSKQMHLADVLNNGPVTAKKAPKRHETVSKA